MVATLHRFCGSIYGTLIPGVVDAHSKWMEVFPLPSISSVIVIGKLQTLFTQFGISQVVMTDSRPSLHKDCILIDK